MAVSFYLSVSKKIQTYLTDNNYVVRRDAGPGVWLPFLLPLGIILGEFKHAGTSQTYKAAASLSCGMLLHAAITLLQANKNRFFTFTNAILPCLVSSGLLHYIASEGIIVSIGVGVSVLIGNHALLLPLIKLCPRNFTYGEASVVLQGFLLFSICCLLRSPLGAKTCMEISTAILQVGIACVLAIGAASYHFNLKRKAKEFYCLATVVISTLLFPPLYLLLGQSPISWIFNLITEDGTLTALVIYWCVCVTLAAAAIAWQNRRDTQATTVTRKCFHILIVLVYAPGIVYHPCFLYLASGVVFALLIAIDMLRVLDMPPFSTVLQTAYLKFGDEKDEGPLALTPIYLLVGCSLPLWLHPASEQAGLLPLISGLLAVGVGDTAASICGSLVGKNKWPGSKKTKEGSAACFLSQLFLVIALIHFGYVPRTNLIRPTFATALVSIVEAKTDQIDNIALPLLMYVLTV